MEYEKNDFWSINEDEYEEDEDWAIYSLEKRYELLITNKNFFKSDDFDIFHNLNYLVQTILSLNL